MTESADDAEPRPDRETLEAALERHRLVMRATHDIVWDADLRHGTATWSGAVEEVLGYRDRSRHSNAWWQSCLHPDDRERVVASLTDAVADPGRALWECHYQFLCREGDYKHLFARGLIIRDHGDVAVRLVGSMMDYTAQKSAEEALVQARLRAEAAQEAKTRLLANVSHELRTPLTSVIGMGELLLDTPLDPQQRHFAETMQRAGGRLLALIDQVLDFARTDAGFTTLQVRPIDLRALVQQLESEFAPLAAHKGLALTVAVAPETPAVVWMDELRIAQILQNLLGNAVKFTTHGGVDLAVEPQALEDREAVSFVVTDTGVGFPEDKREALFELFTQGDDSITREFGGTGLGLAMCKQLTELMGGVIQARSRPAGGSAFTVVIPAHVRPARRVLPDDGAIP